MSVNLPSFAKINLGLRIGALREDGFHELRTVYQTLAWHDTIRVSVTRGSGIEIRSADRRVPLDATNTCYRVVERAMAALKARGHILVEIEKHLPVQGGLGGASGNAVSALLACERALGKTLSWADRWRIAAAVGSDLPLFLIGGTVLGVGRGEEVYPLPDLPAMACVIALPDIAVSTPRAFSDWDQWCDADGEFAGPRAPSSAPRKKGGSTAFGPVGRDEEPGAATPEAGARAGGRSSAGSGHSTATKLKNPAPSDTMTKFSREISAWLSAEPEVVGRRRSGVSAGGGGRAENLLLDLVRTGIENDFEKVVFPQHPELSEVKRVLEQSGARYASLSGSGSAVYGLFASRQGAARAAQKLIERGTRAVVTRTLTRHQYAKSF